MRAFREMRHYIKQNQQFVTQTEMCLVTTKVSDISVQVAGITDWKKKTEKDIEKIQKCAINKIENTAMIHPVIDGLLLGADKTI